MAINFNNQNRGIETLDLSEYGLLQPQNQNMQVVGGYDTGTSERGGKPETNRFSFSPSVSSGVALAFSSHQIRQLPASA